MIHISEIEKAHTRISEIILETPYLKNHNLSEKYDCNIFLKREDMQAVRSFKIRGAYNKIKGLSSENTKNGVVCASAGNHAQGVALSCSKLKIKGTIYMPNPTPNQKISKVKQFGGEWVEVILTGDTFDDASDSALKASQEKNMTLIHPFNDIDVIAGQGTIAKEMLEQLDEPLDYLLVAVGGGGLLSGVGSYFKQMSPKTKVIAVEAEGAAALNASILAGKLTRLDKIDSFADGIAVKEIGDLTFQIIQEVIDVNITVPEGAICSAILKLYNEEAIVVEPAGAVSIAALDQLRDKIKGKSVGVIVCGGNNDVNRTQEITERALLHEGKKHYFIIRFPQRAGALRDFLNVLGPNDDIAHFEYTKKTNRTSGPALVGLEVQNRADFDSLVGRMRAGGINFEHINDNPMLFEMLV
ncbi:MAG: threonine dehydratase [Saprospiraceae bacterium]|jgi:threonine dehydratase|tara:strand:- start:312 stop:1550 length:1239 start_codon:yes stop_codon:yes gene_type:complete